MLLSRSHVTRIASNDVRKEPKKGKAITEIGDIAFFCTNCGTCVGVCPNSALEMREDRNLGVYLPRINPEQCTHCSLCVSVCPGYSHDYVRLNAKVFGQSQMNVKVGNFIQCYTGCSSDRQIRYNSSSGGLVSSLLIAALEDHVIDGAIVTKVEPAEPFRPTPFIARTATEVISASKSKYCPVPVNSLLKTIVAEEGRYAVVGLPCHIHGLRKAEQALPIIRKRVVLHLGLFCSHNVSFLGTDYFLWRSGVDKKDVLSLHYRGGGWPGPPSIKLRDGRSIVDGKGLWNKMFASRLFTPNRCMLCRDSTGELADISFGDPWLDRFKDEKIGKSILICRSQEGRRLIEHALSLGKIQLEQVPPKEVEMSQDSILYKKRVVNAFCRLKANSDCLCRSTGKSFSPRLVDYFVSLIMLLNLELSSKRYVWPVLPTWSRTVKLLKGLQGRVLKKG